MYTELNGFWFISNIVPHLIYFIAYLNSHTYSNNFIRVTKLNWVVHTLWLFGYVLGFNVFLLMKYSFFIQHAVLEAASFLWTFRNFQSELIYLWEISHIIKKGKQGVLGSTSIWSIFVFLIYWCNFTGKFVGIVSYLFTRELQK